ncbi:hypothetical protein HWV62_9067 [Athelia sp. TMB]|nr:hypothetical protein HWV62_9067 [Athelia sp. TMB]
MRIVRMFPKQASIMAKKSIQWNPVLGPFMKMSGTVFIDRGNSAQAHRSLEAAGEGMKSRRTSLFIFAEGTRHSEETPTLLPFKKGAFHLAVKGGIPIVPVVCENYWRLYRKGVFGSGTIKIKVLPPVPTAGLTTEDVSSLTTRVRDQMLSTLREISIDVSSGTAAKSHDSKASLNAAVVTDPPVVSPESKLTELAPSRPETTGSSDTSSVSGSDIRKEGSEAGTETEEDEGMVLVGRP